MKKIAIGSDPNASTLKEVLKEHLKDLGHEFEDYGSDDPIYANVAINSYAARASACVLRQTRYREPMLHSAVTLTQQNAHAKATTQIS
jgi:hypothetical protein